LLRLFQHFQRSIYGVAQVQRGGRAASQPARRDEFDFNASVWDRMRAANSIWIAPPNIPCVGDKSK